MAEPAVKEVKEQSLAPIDMVKRELHLRRKQLEAVLPKHLTPERLSRLAIVACEKTPALLECSRASLYGAILTAAQLGLEPDGILGQAYLVPFKGKVQFIPGYRGLIALARQSGEVQSIFAGAVHEGDHFAYRFGINEQLDHVPSLASDRSSRPITHFYAIAKFINGGHHFDVMTTADVQKIRDNSAAVKSGRPTPWNDHFEEMGKKTAIRRIAKFLPMNVQKAAALVDAHDAGRHAYMEKGDVIDVESRTVATEGKAVGASFFERFEEAAAIETTATEVPAEDVSQEREPGEDDEPQAEPLATKQDYTDIETRAKKKNLTDAALEALCMRACGKALGELTHADATAVILELAKKG